MTTLSTGTAVPLPGTKVQVYFALTETGAKYVRVWLTNAPPNSPLLTSLKVNNYREQIYEGDGGTSNPYTFEAAVGGQYILVAQEYSRALPRFANDQNAGKESTIGSEATLTLRIAEYATFKIGPAAHSVDLKLTVLNDDVKFAVLENASSDRAKTALRASAVEAARLAFEGADVDAILGDPETILTQMVTEYTDHIGNSPSAYHTAADAVNVVSATLKNPKTPTAQIETNNRLLRALRAHIASDSGTGTGSANYHPVAGADSLLVTSISDPGQLYTGMADFHRVYEAHRARANAHTGAGGADTTNTLTALPPLGVLCSAFLAEVSKVAPTPPATQNSGITKLVAVAGFKAT